MRKKDDDRFEDDPDLSSEDREILANIIEFSRSRFIAEDDENDEEKILEKIKEIEQELENSNIDAITAEWVEEWNRKKESNSDSVPGTKEKAGFKSGSLNSDEAVPAGNNLNRFKKVSIRTLLISTVSLAALLTGVVLLVQSLLPSSDPESIYESFYEPFKVVSSVTRNSEQNQDIYLSAIEKYRLGDYTGAAAGFSISLAKDTSNAAPAFFMGLTQMAMGNYDKAINLLSKLPSRQDEFKKESLWYLGLSYLKTGETEKAENCFRALTKTPGFYYEPSLKVLRRIK